jgi:hypothetical protein
MPPRHGRRKTADGPTLEAFFGGVLALAPAYFLAEGALRAYPHVTHWVGTGLGIAGGYGLGALVAAYKEERPPFGRGSARMGSRTGVRPQPEGRDERSATAKRRTGR